MSEADHANASRWREITTATSFCSSWLNKRPNLITLPPIFLSNTLSTGWGRLSRALSARDSPLLPSLIGVAPLGASGVASSDAPSVGEVVEPSGVQALKNPNPLKDVQALAVLVVAVLV